MGDTARVHGRWAQRVCWSRTRTGGAIEPERCLSPASPWTNGSTEAGGTVAQRQRRSAAWRWGPMKRHWRVCGRGGSPRVSGLHRGIRPPAHPRTSERQAHADASLPRRRSGGQAHEEGGRAVVQATKAPLVLAGCRGKTDQADLLTPPPNTRAGLPQCHRQYQPQRASSRRARLGGNRSLARGPSRKCQAHLGRVPEGLCTFRKV